MHRFILRESNNPVILRILRLQVSSAFFSNEIYLHLGSTWIDYIAHWLSIPFYIIKMLDCLVGEIFNESGTKRFQSWWGNCHTPRIPMVQSSQEWLPGMVGTLTNMCQVPIELLPTRTRLQTSGKHGGYWRWVSLILGSVSQRRRRAKTTTSFILLGCWQTNTNTRSIYLNHSNHSKHSTLSDERCGWVILPRLRWYI